MILSQIFKTAEGARKRALFENAHSKSHKYSPVRFYRGKIDLEEFKRERFSDYTWRLRKEPRP
jgi:hypothetical protein